jgi:hypothetical protein
LQREILRACFVTSRNSTDSCPGFSASRSAPDGLSGENIAD